MNLIKYSPKFHNLKTRDEDAYHLLVGFIRKNATRQIAYAILSLILMHWDSIQIIKLLQLTKKYQTLTNENQLELAKLTTSFTIKNCQYKFAINLNNSLSVHVYPFSGLYNYNQTIKAIKKKDGSSWKALNKIVKIKFEIYKATSCRDTCLKKEEGSYVKLYLKAGTKFEGIIHVDMKSNMDQCSILQMTVWDQDQIQREGYTIYKQCECQNEQYSSTTTRKGWVFIE